MQAQGNKLFFLSILPIVRNWFKVFSSIWLKNFDTVGCDARASFSSTDLNTGSFVSSSKASGGECTRHTSLKLCYDDSIITYVRGYRRE